VLTFFGIFAAAPLAAPSLAADPRGLIAGP
jgi:hypothetical protein